MKLRLTVPSRPGWIYLSPGFDYLLTLLAIVLCGGVLTQERVVEVRRSTSLEGKSWLDPQQFIRLSVSPSRMGWEYSLMGKPVKAASVDDELQKALMASESKKVAIRFDPACPVSLEQDLMEIVRRHDGQYFRVIDSNHEKQ